MHRSFGLYSIGFRALQSSKPSGHRRSYAASHAVDAGLLVSRDLSVGLSESARGYPEVLAPLAARRNALQFLVHSCMRQVERVGDSGHGLEADEAPAGRSVNDGDSVLRAVLNRNFLVLPLHGKFSAAVRPSYQVAEDVVELHTAQRHETRELHWSPFAGRNKLRRQRELVARGNVGAPLVAWRVMNLKVGMEPDPGRHRLRGMILYQCLQPEPP